MDLFLFEKLAVTRLRQRCVVDEADTAYFRIDKSSTVALPAAEWDALGIRFHTAIAPSARRLRWSVWLAIPVALATLVLVHRVPVLEAALDPVDALTPGVLPVLLGSGLPLAAMIAHMLAVQREIDRTCSLLARRPRRSAPVTPPRRGLNLAELAAIVLVGPHLAIQALGTLVPDALRNTPWTGTRLDWTGAAGLVVLVMLAVLRWREHSSRGAYRAEIADPGAPLAARNRLRTDVFGRKRG